MVLRFATSGLIMSVVSFSPALYGVESTAIQAAMDRYKVVGVISEESPRKPLAGIAVLKDTRTSETLTLTIGDPLPSDAQFSIISTKSGQVVVSSGQEEFALQHSETAMEPATPSDQAGFDDLNGKWQDNVSMLGKASALSKDKRLIPESDLGTSGPSTGTSLSPTDDKMRFPYYKVDTMLGDAEVGREPAIDPFLEIDSFSQDWDWIPASDLTLTDIGMGEPEAPRILEGPSMNPWWVGEDEAFAPSKSDL